MIHQVKPSGFELSIPTKSMLTLKAILLTTIYLTLAACSSHQTGFNNLPNINLNDLEGEWYIIANIPYFFEKGHVSSKVEYRARQEDEKFDDIYRFKDGNFSAIEESYTGIAKIKDKNTNAAWSSSFFWPISFSWNIYDLDIDDQTLVIGHPSKRYAWIMSRQPKLSETKYQSLLTLLENRGFEKLKLKKIPQFKNQLNQPGFQ